jgi:hypothetical protein
MKQQSEPQQNYHPTTNRWFWGFQDSKLDVPTKLTQNQGWEKPTFSNSAGWVLGFSMKNPIKPMGF